MSKAKIFCYSNVVGGRAGIAYALAEDGTVLGTHFCSHEGFVCHDLGVTEGTRPDRHKTYVEHYPDGYEMEFVRSGEVDTHSGISRAVELNKLNKSAKEATNSGDHFHCDIETEPPEPTP